MVSGQEPLQRKKTSLQQRKQQGRSTARYAKTWYLLYGGSKSDFFFILLICIFFLHSWLWCKKRDAESMNFDVY